MISYQKNSVRRVELSRSTYKKANKVDGVRAKSSSTG
jgi:hypothetical protein